MRPPAGRYAQPSWVSTVWVLDCAAVAILALAGALHRTLPTPAVGEPELRDACWPLIMISLQLQ